MRILAPMRHLAAFLFVVAACGGDGVGGGVPLYGGGCESDGDCEAGAVCGSAGNAPGLCSTECAADDDCSGWASCDPANGYCIENCLDATGCDEGTSCVVFEGEGIGHCYPIPPPTP